MSKKKEKAKEEPVPVQQIAVASLRPSPFQERKSEDKAEFAKLVRSVKQLGIIEPLVVRWVSGTVEIIAGHRRHAAAKSAKLNTVPAYVLDVSDEVAAAMVLSENMHRRPLTPYEQAASVASLTEIHRGNLAAVASVLGLEPRAVASLARLAKLSESWRKAWADEASVVAGWTPAHLEKIARLPTQEQEALYEDMKFALPARPTVEQIAQRVAERLRKLSEVPWLLRDEALVEAAGPCSTCPKRTAAVPLLFDDVADSGSVKGDRCLDGACFEGKHRAWEAVEVARLASEHGRVLMVLSDGHRPRPDGVTLITTPDGVERRSRVDGGMPVVVGDGPDRGKHFFGVPKSVPPPSADALRLQEVREAIREFRAAALARPVPVPAHILSFVSAFGVGNVARDGAFERLQVGHAEQQKTVWGWVLEMLVQRVGPSVKDPEELLAEAVRIEKVLGFRCEAVHRLIV